MANIQFATKGISSVFEADANLRNYKITSADIVKERSFFGKLYVRIMDYFDRKTAEGCARINQRNIDIHNAMITMMQARVEAKLNRMENEAPRREGTRASAPTEREAMYAELSNLGSRIGLLANCRAMPPEVLRKVQNATPNTLDFLQHVSDPDLQGRLINLLTCSVDREVLKEGFIELLTRDLNKDESASFRKDVLRQLVKFPARPEDQENPEAMRGHFARISQGTPEVERFLVNVCNQSGILYANVGTLMGESAVEIPELPKMGDFTAACLNLGNGVEDWLYDAITVTSREDGSIDICSKLDLKALNQGLDETTPGAVAYLQTHVNIHLPVDGNGAFILKDGQPDFVIERFEINNIHRP